MLGTKFGQDTNNIGAAVLSQGPGDDFEGVSQGAVRELFLAFDGLGLLVKS